MNEPTLLPAYKPLFNTPKHRYFVLTGGRGSAKSWHVAYFLLWLTYDTSSPQVILFTRWTLTSAHISIIPEFREKIELLGTEAHFDIKQTEIINRITGNRIIFRGIKTSQGTATANLKSIQGVTTYVLDEAEELTDFETFEKIDLSIRAKDSPNRVILIMNPSYKSHFVYEQFLKLNRPDVMHIHTSYLDNIQNLSDSFIEQADRTKQTNPLRYEHIFLGRWLEDQEGLLWNRAIIERTRVQKHPELYRIIVSIDPAISANKDSDETGIVVLAVDGKNNGYVLDDQSGTHTPLQWAHVAYRLAEKWQATAYVAEKNQGGDMVEAVIRQVDKDRRIKLVSATKGKYLRAEPVFALYEQNRIFHVGHFPKLEQQMITFNPDSNDKSPDRVDAMVHGFTELFQPQQSTFQIA